MHRFIYIESREWSQDADGLINTKSEYIPFLRLFLSVSSPSYCAVKVKIPPENILKTAIIQQF